MTRVRRDSQRPHRLSGNSYLKVGQRYNPATWLTAIARSAFELARRRYARPAVSETAATMAI